jgi:hypothetical protein
LPKQFPSKLERNAARQAMKALSRQDLLDAIAKLDARTEHGFADSTDYDVLHGERRYPPKAVVGLAITTTNGLPVGPYHFKGGLRTPCFRTLEAHGFDIVPKPDCYPEGYRS